MAAELCRRPETRATGEALGVMENKFQAEWSAGNNLSVALPGLPMPPPRNQGLHPNGSVAFGAHICFEFSLGENIERDILPARADFQVCVKGGLDLPERLIELEDHWRVDTDIKTVAAHPSREPHPHIHFQRGGHAQDAFARSGGFVPGDSLPTGAPDIWRGLFQSPGPRLPLFPMCPVLAIDFTIGQHDGIAWRRLRGNPKYLAIVERAQERLWRPVFDGLNDMTFRRRWFGPVLL
ncbi:MAG: hypothetical protein JWM10_2826 [Myxococcaceae bacterium]|nr:hypothetical protein [Myxococcaceae bacterium]